MTAMSETEAAELARRLTLADDLEAATGWNNALGDDRDPASPPWIGFQIGRVTDELATAVAEAARDFCAELCEDSPDVPQPQLKALHAALDAWEAGQ